MNNKLKILIIFIIIGLISLLILCFKNYYENKNIYDKDEYKTYKITTYILFNSSESLDITIFCDNKILIRSIIEKNSSSNGENKLAIGGKRIEIGLHKITVYEKNFNLSITKEVEIDSDIELNIYLTEKDIKLEFKS